MVTPNEMIKRKTKIDWLLCEWMENRVKIFQLINFIKKSPEIFLQLLNDGKELSYKPTASWSRFECLED